MNKHHSQKQNDLYSDEIHDIFSPTASPLQHLGALWLLITLLSLGTALITIRIPIRQEAKKGEETILIDREVSLTELLLKRPLFENQEILLSEE